MESLKELRQKGKALKPIVHIGKFGFTSNAYNELMLHLKSKKLVKVKFLRAYIEGKDKKSEANNLVTLTGAKLVEQVGNVVVLYKS